MSLARFSSFARTAARTSFDILRDLIMPPMCAHCRIFLPERQVFCHGCSLQVLPIVSTTLEVTAKKQVTVFSVSDYKAPIRSLILAKGRSDIISARQLGELIWERTYLKNSSFDYLVPIPLHWSRFAKRGFNQAHEMAKVLARKSGCPVAPILKRNRRTVFQASIAPDMRAENVKEVFELRVKDPQMYRDKHLVLVDDLMTTGATLKVAARELYKLRPARLSIVVACRVV